MGKHSLLGPSSIHRRELCPGSLRMEKGVPDHETVEAGKGTLLHALLAEAFKHELPREDTPQLEPADVVAMQECIDFGGRHMREHPEAEILIEKRFDLSELHPGIGFGTADFVLVEPFKWALVVDWKFGHIDPPPAKRNPQLAIFAWELASAYECPVVDVALVLGFQGKTSTHRYRGDDFHDIEQHMRAVADHALSSWAPLRPSDDACRYCRRAKQGDCPALIERSAALPTAAAGSLGAAEVGRLLGLAEGVGALLKGLKHRAYEILSAGGDVPGWWLKAGRSNRSWTAAATEKKLTEIAKELGKPEAAIVERKLASIAMVEKKWGKAKAVREKLDPLVERKAGKPTLTKVTRKETDADGDNQ